MSQSQNPEPILGVELVETSPKPGETSNGENGEVPVAEVVEPEVVVAKPFVLTLNEPPPIPNVAAIGGAVASCMLGTLSIIGVLISPLSIINGILGVLFGMWGLYSPRKRLAFIGICLGITGVILNIGKVLLDLTAVFEGMGL